MLHWVVLLLGCDDQDSCLGTGQERTIEPGEALLPDFVEQLLPPFDLALWTELERYEGLGPSPDAMADIIAGHDEVLALIVAATDDDVGVGVPGVEMVDGHPVELGVEVALHLRHEVARKWLQFGQQRPVIGRDHEPELVRVLLRAIEKGAAIGVVADGFVEPAWRALAVHPVAHDLLEVRTRRAEIAVVSPGYSAVRYGYIL